MGGKRKARFGPPPEILVVQSRKKKTTIRAPRNQPVRDLARLLYVTDPRTPSIPELASMPEFKGTPLATLVGWSKADHWMERRAEYQEQVFERAKAQVGARMVKNYVQLTGSLWTMFEDGIKKLTGLDEKFKVPPARSLEALMRSVAYVGVTYAELARHVIDATVPTEAVQGAEEGEAQVGTSMAATLTPEEHQAAVATILRMRMEAMASGVHTDEEEEGQNFTKVQAKGSDPQASGK